LIWINRISHARYTIGSFRDGSAQDERLDETSPRIMAVLNQSGGIG
jgi:hypothetical protein